jgi:hypothetical protein
MRLVLRQLPPHCGNAVRTQSLTVGNVSLESLGARRFAVSAMTGDARTAILIAAQITFRFVRIVDLHFCILKLAHPAHLLWSE